MGNAEGDPFKDTAEPSLHILIKVMNIVGLLVAPIAPMYGRGGPKETGPLLPVIGIVVAAIMGIALIISQRESAGVTDVHATITAQREEAPQTSVF